MRMVPVAAPRRLPRDVRVDERYVAQEVSTGHKHVTDLGKQLLSAFPFGIGAAMQQREAQVQPGETQLQVVAGSFGDRERILDLA